MHAASQPPTVRNYTVAGYEKRPTPPGLLAVLQDYFERHKAEYTREVRTSYEIVTLYFSAILLETFEIFFEIFFPESRTVLILVTISIKW